MRRLVMTVAVVGVAVLFRVGAAHAFQCPRLIDQINALANTRFDTTGYEAREKAAQAERLHQEGKHAESEQAAKDGLAKLGIRL